MPDLFVFPGGETGLSPTTLEDPRGGAVAARRGATPAEVLLGWQLRVGVSINPRSISAQHMREGLRALDVAEQLTEGCCRSQLLHRTWCSVVPEYQCAPDPRDPRHKARARVGRLPQRHVELSICSVA